MLMDHDYWLQNFVIGLINYVQKSDKTQKKKILVTKVDKLILFLSTFIYFIVMISRNSKILSITI